MSERRAGVVGVFGIKLKEGGTGEVVGRNLVLTSLHVLARQKPELDNLRLPETPPPEAMDAAEQWLERAAVAKVVHGDASGNKGRAGQPTRLVFRATLAWRPAADHPDAALLRLHPRPGQPDLVPEGDVKFAAFRGGNPLLAFARGFPRLTEEEVTYAALEWLSGQAKMGSSDWEERPIRIDHVLGNPLNLAPSAWQGVSGAAVFAHTYLLGIIERYSGVYDGRQTLHVVPIERLLDEREFCEAAGWRHGDALPQAAPPPETPPQPSFDKLLPFAYRINREKPSRRIEAALEDNLTRGPIEIVVSGNAKDRCDQFFELVWRHYVCPPESDGRPLAPHLRRRPPIPLAWPDYSDVERDRVSRVAAGLLARTFLKSQAGSAPFGTKLDAAITTLLNQKHPLWLSLALPNDNGQLSDSDIGLLKDLRTAYAAAWKATEGTRDPNFPVGYMLTWNSDRDLPVQLTNPTFLGGCKQVHVGLGQLSLQDVREWARTLADDDADGKVSESELAKLARTLAQGLATRGIHDLRLGELIELLEAPLPGGLASARGEPAWAAERLPS
jgi:hypothetical protein